MDAMILAAGQGTRMLPLTEKTPKPLLKVGGHSLLDYHLSLLADLGLKKVVINVSHLHEKIDKYLKENSHLKIDIDLSVEESGPIGTAEGIRQCVHKFTDDLVFVMSGDLFTDCRPQNLELDDGYDAHLVLVPNPNHRSMGDFLFHDGILQPLDNQKIGLTFSGIGIYRTELFRDSKYTSNDLGDMLRQLVKEGKVSGEVYEGIWVDVGNIERLEEARELADSSL
ncbi:MAG: nucleotidyltransferase family protein [Gammaproteobacteria bacterium]|nr:nucleotidyltransferase family protein [Gammaproteobacteria bacterium]MCY4275910.1 nucleotidyltransferase family protein [Gammaproteobacteria bacterium]